ncbi:peroxiredoxin [Candidatus Omnitrophota bacterium]
MNENSYLFTLSMFCIVCILLFALFAGAETITLNIGDKAPNFYANDDNGDLWELEKHLGKNYVIVYFYPAALTGGCTKQACSYRDNKKELSKLDVDIIGISGDPVKNLKIFKDIHDLNFSLLSDVSGDIAKKFGVPLKDGGEIKKTIEGTVFSLGRSYTEARWTFIIGKDGNVIYKDTEVNAENDSKNVINFLKAL